MSADAINVARERIWIVSPYFVPDEQLMSALQLAALRGVDVRVLIPENPDQNLVYYSSFSYLEEADKSGIKIFRYQPGFLHQKVMLIDDDFARRTRVRHGCLCGGVSVRPGAPELGGRERDSSTITDPSEAAMPGEGRFHFTSRWPASSLHACCVIAELPPARFEPKKRRREYIDIA